MLVKKSGGKVFGGVLTSDEKKALDIEIQKKLAEDIVTHEQEIDAIILWQLRTELGFGYNRLKNFYMSFSKNLHGLIDRYELENRDAIWIATKELKEYGIDIQEWSKELHT